MKEEALDRTVWRRRFGRNYGLVEDRLRIEWKRNLQNASWEAAGLKFALDLRHGKPPA